MAKWQLPCLDEQLNLSGARSLQSGQARSAAHMALRRRHASVSLRLAQIAPSSLLTLMLHIALGMMLLCNGYKTRYQLCA